ncbi:MULTISPECIES: hypothetical protein [unclassified Aureimonas]|uniref:hypothetical protein n=1 Tax=unclassified Aureimonas TaxID=2615206 RepID=UPI0012E3CA56|nr:MULTISPECIES: hypothetical protein [unclassified Aureimonas]
MSFVGVDEAQWSRVADQVKRYGFDENGVPVANTEAWTDQTAKRIFYAAVLKDVRSTIVAKGVADVPVFAHKPIGRALLQFKTFSLASNQRVLMRGLQEDKSNLVGGIVAMTAMGAFTYWLKQMEAGRDVSSNPGT